MLTYRNLPFGATAMAKGRRGQGKAPMVFSWPEDDTHGDDLVRGLVQHIEDAAGAGRGAAGG